jgi:RND family efflux transporter MFP subunit
MSIRKKISQLALPVFAFGLFGFAIATTIKPDLGRAAPPIAPPSAPFAAQVGAIGVVEPAGEMIAIASDLPGVVREVFVRPGDAVAKGAPLFRLDDRAQSASLAEAEAEARAAEIAAADEAQRLKLYKSVKDPRALSADEMARRNFGAAGARARAEAARARAAVIRTQIDMLTVRAPIDGRVYSVDARPGEFAAAGPLATPLMTIGSAALHLRAEVDETDAPRVASGAKAVGSPRGRSAETIALAFIRFEPRATEKRALAGGSERVDARVIEAIYALPDGAPVLVGQRVDVFIEAAARPSPTAAAGGAR